MEVDDIADRQEGNRLPPDPGRRRQNGRRLQVNHLHPPPPPGREQFRLELERAETDPGRTGFLRQPGGLKQRPAEFRVGEDPGTGERSPVASRLKLS